MMRVLNRKGIKDMSFGENLQFLRKMRNKMSQEELAEKMSVSRQTVSKWELNTAYPEISKIIELCELFSCTMDQLLREDMNIVDDAFSDIRVEEVPAFRYVKYAVLSQEPEDDAITHVNGWAKKLGIREPKIIGWDLPILSQEQVNVFHMHGYEAALILEEDISESDMEMTVHSQEKQKYVAITIKEPFQAPFQVIPNAYKVLMSHIEVNGIDHHCDKNVIGCFEKSYFVDGIEYMDVYIAIAS